MLKRNALSSHENTRRKLKCIFLSGRSRSEKVAGLYNSNCVTFQQRQNYRDSKKIRVVRGYGQMKR